MTRLDVAWHHSQEEEDDEKGKKKRFRSLFPPAPLPKKKNLR